MELVGPNKRLWTGNVSALFLASGSEFLVLMVYLLRDWKWFVLAVSLPGCLFLPYYWYVELITVSSAYQELIGTMTLFSL